MIIPEAITKFPANLAQWMVDERISVWYSVPFALIQLLQRGTLPARDLRALRWVLFAGEPFPTKHLRALMECWPWPQYFNLYGPTETNVCTYYTLRAPLPDSQTVPLPIGRKCSGDDTRVIGADGAAVEAG